MLEGLRLAWELHNVHTGPNRAETCSPRICLSLETIRVNLLRSLSLRHHFIIFFAAIFSAMETYLSYILGLFVAHKCEINEIKYFVFGTRTRCTISILRNYSHGLTICSKPNFHQTVCQVTRSLFTSTEAVCHFIDTECYSFRFPHFFLWRKLKNTM